jgi:hypothetical protein
VAAGLSRAAPGGFTVRPIAPAAARRAVRDQDADGALVIPASGPNVVVTAGAAGPTLQRAITAALGAASAAMHRGTRAVDVAPLPPGDRAGLGSFVFELGLLIPSVLGSVGLFLVGLRARLWWRIAAAALFAVLVAAGGVLVLDPALGMLHGAALETFAIGALGAGTFVLVIAVCQATVGLPGTGVAAFTFIFVGNAIAGGAVPRKLLPDGYRQLSEWMPNGAIVRGVRDVVYFDGNGLGHPLLVFGIWTAAALVMLIAIDLLQLSERRAAPGRPHAEIHATPAVGHVAARRRRRAARTGDRDDGGPAA